MEITSLGWLGSHAVGAEWPSPAVRLFQIHADAATLPLPFWAHGVMNRHARSAERIHHHEDRSSRNYRKHRHRCGTGRDSCAGESHLEEGASQKKGAPKG